MLLGTVGVAPGTYTMQLGHASERRVGVTAPCGPDPTGWYMTNDAMLADYQAMYTGMTSTAGGPMTAMPPPTYYMAAGPRVALKPDARSGVAFNPYGTDMTLNGFRDAPPPIKFGLRLDILGVVLGGILATGLIISALADRHR